jgi:thiol-disulfide isomerase/thioredoxin
MKRTRTILSVFAVLAILAAAASAQTLTALSGEKVNVQAREGKVVVLAVGASWLPLSKEQAAIVTKLQKRYVGKNVEFFFVATDSTNQRSKNFASDEQLKAFAAKNKLGAEILRDPDGLLTLKKYAIDQLPSFVILDRSGKASGEVFSGIDPENDLSLPISKMIDRLI